MSYGKLSSFPFQGLANALGLETDLYKTYTKPAPPVIKIFLTFTRGSNMVAPVSPRKLVLSAGSASGEFGLVLTSPFCKLQQM